MVYRQNDMQNDNLSEVEIKFIKDNFGSLKIPKEDQKDFLSYIKQYLTWIKEGKEITLKNWFGTRLEFSYNKEECCFYIRKGYSPRAIFSKEKWMKKLAKSTLLILKEENYKDNNKKFLEDSIKITNDISNAKIDEPLNIPIVKQKFITNNIISFFTIFLILLTPVLVIIVNQYLK